MQTQSTTTRIEVWADDVVGYASKSAGDKVDIVFPNFRLTAKSSRRDTVTTSSDFGRHHFGNLEDCIRRSKPV
jgi:hypothetical protein